MNDKVKGYALAAIAAATYGMNPLFALPLYGEGLSPASVLFFRYLLAIPLLGGMLALRGRSFRLQRHEVLPLVAMGVLMALSSLCLFESYHYMEAGIASTILFVYPIMVALIMTLAFKERLTAQTMLCIGMALGGIGLLYKGSDGATLSLTGTIFVLMSALTYAIYIVGVNKSVLKDVATLKVTFYVIAFGLLVFLGLFAYGEPLQAPDGGHWYLWGNLLALAAFPTAISFLCTTKAIHYIGSTPTAILGALEPATAIFFGITVFGETLTLRDAVGLVLIIVAVTLVIAGGRVARPLLRLRKLFPRIRW